MNDMIVRTALRFASPMFSPWGLPMAFFARIARKAPATLDIIADPKASHVNESSVKLERATPPTIGRRLRYTGSEKTCPSKDAERMHATTGSEALTIWTKLTAPAPIAMVPPTCAARCAVQTPDKFLTCSADSFGAARSPLIQRKNTYGMPQPKATVAAVHGSGTAVRARLLKMLFAKLNP